VEKKPKSLQALVDTEDSANQDSKKEQALVDIGDPISQDSKTDPNQRFLVFSYHVRICLVLHNVRNDFSF
jgi:hypothetical protein